MITDSIEIIKKDLLESKVIGLPTETVYGLAANAFDEEAIQEIYRIKGRPSTNPLIVHIGNFTQLKTVAKEIPEKLFLLAEQFWPGPLTLLLPKRGEISASVTAGFPNVGVRMPNHPKALELLNQIPFPLVAPSANISNRISPTTAQHVEKYFADIHTLEGGECISGLESTILGIEGGEIAVYRWGAIGREEIEKLVGKVLNRTQATHSTPAPGMSKKHYAPKCPLVVSQEPGLLLSLSMRQRVGVIWFKEVKWEFPQVICNEVLSNSGDLKEAGKNLYQTLHRMEELSLDLIIAERMPEEGLGLSINDRLDRASSKI